MQTTGPISGDVEEDGDICRVCRTGSSPDRPLNYPCKCSGSIRFIHQDCLLMWLTHSKTKYCELCGHQFEFTPIYADNAPNVLAPHEIMLGLLQRAGVGLRGALRIALVIFCWFIIVPLATSAIFYLYFGRPVYGFSLRHIRISYPCWVFSCYFYVQLYCEKYNKYDISFDTASTFVMDCAFGSFISAMVIFVCLLVMSLMDFVNNMPVPENHHVPVVQPVVQPAAHLIVQPVVPPIPQPVVQHAVQPAIQPNVHPVVNPIYPTVQPAMRGILPNQNNNLPQNLGPVGNQYFEDGDDDIYDDTVDDEQHDNDDMDSDEDAPDFLDSDHEDPDMNNTGPDLIEQYNEMMAMLDQIPHADLPLPAPAPDAGVDAGAQGGVGDVEQVEDDDNFLGNMLFGFLDANAGEVDFNELVGVVGPLTGLALRVIALTLFNGSFLAMFALAPLLLGRMILQWRLHPFGIIKEFVSNILVNDTVTQILGMFALSSDTINQTLSNTTIPTFDNTTILANVTSLNNSTILENTAKLATSEFGTADLDAIFVGYLFITLISVAWIGLTLTLSANFAFSRNPVYRAFTKSLKVALTATKVALVMFSELGLFPLLIGNTLDFCTLGLFGVSVESRIGACRRNPLICQALHWGLGFSYMILFASFVGWVREVVRPGVLWFFRDPTDPNFNPLKEIVDQPVSRHVKRLLLSALIYAVIISLVIFLPILIGKFLWPSLFPLNIWLGDPFYEGPIDLIFVHVIVPYTLEYCHPKANFKLLLRTWLGFISNKLGIVEYMLPPPAPPALVGAPAPAPAPALVDPIANANANVNAIADAVNPVANLVAAIVNNAVPVAPTPVATVAPYKPPLFALRVSLLIVSILVVLNCAWISMFILNSLLISVPIAAGRFMFSQLSFPLTNDLYTFCAGFYALYGAARVTQATINFMTSLPLPQIASEMYIYIVLGIKCAIIGFFLGIVIPLLIGLVFELVFAIPWRVAVDQSPHFFIYQDWGLGLIYMKVWYRVIVARAEYLRIQPPTSYQGYDMHAIEWKIRIDQIFQDGVRNMKFTRIFDLIILPILDKIFLMLCVPYVIAKGLVPLLVIFTHLMKKKE